MKDKSKEEVNREKLIQEIKTTNEEILNIGIIYLKDKELLRELSNLKISLEDIFSIIKIK